MGFALLSPSYIATLAELARSYGVGKSTIWQLAYR